MELTPRFFFIYKSALFMKNETEKSIMAFVPRPRDGGLRQVIE